MTILEFKNAVKARAGGKYHAVHVEVSDHPGDEMVIEWSAYIAPEHRSGRGWTKSYKTAQEVLNELDSIEPPKPQPAITDEDIAALGDPGVGVGA